MDVIVQLFQQIKGICGTVKDPVDQVKALTSAVSTPTLATAPSSISQPTEPPRPQQPAVDYRSIVHEELKEMKERDKRRQSVIIKGLKASSSDDLAAKFEQLTEQVMGTKIGISDISPIPGHSQIYRAKIMNDDLRKTVLEKAKTLRNADFNSVYISRDLTYAQRSELFTRRKARQEEPAQTRSQTVPQLHVPENASPPALSGN